MTDCMGPAQLGKSACASMLAKAKKANAANLAFMMHSFSISMAINAPMLSPKES
jgi:hypothetical protein